MGDAAGVGPELCLHLLAHEAAHAHSVPLVIGSADVLRHVAQALGQPFTAECFETLPDSIQRPAVFTPPGSLRFEEIVPRQNQACCGRASAKFIEEAVSGCMARRFAAMVTAPVSKKALQLAGIGFPGHTEMLGSLTHTENYAMLMYSPQIACAFVTSHQSLRSVPDALTVERVVEVTELAWRNVAALKGAAPRLCMLGLNPHAGEEGLFGDEEQRIILPAQKILKERGIPADGPLPPDTAFTPALRSRYDCFIAHYHDQGCIPFKMLAFDTGVNITIGLPVIRTSPDHGTAFDIAWQGKVQPESFLSAYNLAERLSLNSKVKS